MEPVLLANETSNGCSKTGVAGLSITVPLIAAVILIVLSFTQRRTRLWKQCLRGVPGIIVPLDLLTITPYRLIYVVTFGAMSGDLLGNALQIILHRDTLPLSGNPYWNVFIIAVLSPIVLVLYLSTKYFPVFACVSAPIPLIGHMLGLLYSCLLVAYAVYSDYVLIYCPIQDDTLLGIAVASRAAVYACYLIILVWYFIELLKDFRLMCHNGFSDAFVPKEPKQSLYYERYVRCLLRKRVQEDHGTMTALLTRSLNFIVPYGMSPLKLPLKFLGALVIMFMIMYQLTFVFAGLFFYLTTLVLQLLKDNEQSIKASFENLSLSEAYDDIVSFSEGIAVVLPGAPMVSFTICLVLLAHMVASVHKNLQRVARGDVSFLSRSLSPSAFTVSASWRYAGYQVAFFIAGYMIYTILLWLVGFSGILIFFGFKYFPDILFHVLTAFLITVGWTAVVYFGQVALCWLLFLESGGGRFALITNRRLFNWFAYMLFFYNAIVGFMAALLRMLAAFLFSLILLIRLDRVVLMKGFEFWDVGYKTYIGFLYLEYTYSNPVVNVFVKLLSRDVMNRDGFSGFRNIQFGSSEESPFGESAKVPMLKDSGNKNAYGSYRLHSAASPFSDGKPSKSQQARNRWLVAYTLLRNPSLQKLTASRLQEGRAALDPYGDL